MVTIKNILSENDIEWSFPDKINNLSMGNEKYVLMNKSNEILRVINEDKSVAVIVNRERHRITKMELMDDERVLVRTWVPNKDSLRENEDIFPRDKTWL